MADAKITDLTTATSYTNKYLPIENSTDGTEKMLTNNLFVVVATSSSFSSLPQTLSDSNITANHVVVNAVLSDPSAQTGDWTVTTGNGSATVSGSISGSTTLTLYLAMKA